MESLQQEIANPKVEGDGKAVFIELGTEEEYEEYKVKEEQGWESFFKKIFNPKENDEADS